MRSGDVYVLGPVWPTHPPPAHLQFQEWSDERTDQLHAAAGRDRSPCIICTNPTGDCTHHLGGPVVMTSPSQSQQKDNLKKASSGKEPVSSEHAAQNAATVQAVIDTDPGEVLGAKVVRVDGHVEKGMYDEQESEKYVRLKDPILEEFFFPDTKRPSYRIKYPAGYVVAQSVIDQYNADTDLQNRLREQGRESDTAVDYVDTSTRAAGTNPGLTKDEQKAADKAQ